MLATCPASLSAASPMKVKLFSLAITFFASSIISVMKALMKSLLRPWQGPYP